MAYFSADFLEFFKELAGNNNKEWFDINRKRYEKEVKIPFSLFVQDMINTIQNDDPEVRIAPKDSIFRINRDIRFSKDKTPYKLKVSAIISRGGKKDKVSPGIYIELTPEHVRVYGGVFMCDKEQLYNVRTYISTHLNEFEKVLKNKKFVEKFGEVRGDRNKIIPKEFREIGEKQPMMYNKQFYYFGQLDPEIVLDENLINIIYDFYLASKPMKVFLTKALMD